MSALDIVPFGETGYWGRRIAVEAWERAGSPPLVSGGRFYADQKDAWDKYEAGTGNPADNPDDETQRLAHCRFVAVDLKNPARDRAAMQRAGYIFPYSYEPWHCELPNVRSYAIVRSIPLPAAISAAPFIPTQEDDVAFICKTPINGLNATNGVHSWICDPSAGTKRNIDFAEYDFLQSLGTRELSGLQSPAITNRYQQIN